MAHSGQSDNIYLIGPMGVGKSTVGRQLAKTRGWTFVDSDREIESRTGVSIATVFEYEGEAGFRKREKAVIADFVQRSPIVLATGGGVVLCQANREALSSHGFVVYLTCSVDKLLHRTRSDTERPLLQNTDRRQRIEELLHEREPLYRECAHFIVNTGENPTKSAVAMILRAFDGD
ncbi:MAG TPA: shikimate kinase [Crenotrichaceae bacterium]|nr:shikimate kinase [Crenotrichaceae bacterium]